MDAVRVVVRDKDVRKVISDRAKLRGIREGYKSDFIGEAHHWSLALRPNLVTCVDGAGAYLAANTPENHAGIREVTIDEFLQAIDEFVPPVEVTTASKSAARKSRHRR